jgi:hypothetical protein
MEETFPLLSKCVFNVTRSKAASALAYRGNQCVVPYFYALYTHPQRNAETQWPLYIYLIIFLSVRAEPAVRMFRLVYIPTYAVNLSVF